MSAQYEVAPVTVSRQRLLGASWKVGLVCAVAGGVASIYAWFADSHAFFSAWLAAFHFWLSMPLGALALLLIWDLTGGRWEALARVPLSAMAATMPLFLLLFLPIIAGLTELYPWARPSVAATLHNRWYLNLTFFYIRVGVYFVAWNALAMWRAWPAASPTRAPPPGPAGPTRARPQWLSAIGLLLMVYTITYSSIDWILSTDPRWFSSIFGMIACSGQLIAALSAALLLTVAQVPPRARGESAFTQALAPLAAILLAAVIFWMYAEFCQWLIVWEENMRTEIHWYVVRWRGPWAAVIYALVAAHFGVPFATLVWGPAKRNAVVVSSVCAVVLVADMVRVWWLLLPSLEGVRFSWIHPAVMIGMGGLWLLMLAGVLRLTGGHTQRARDTSQEGFIHG
jgi:hypothetical protein